LRRTAARRFLANVSEILAVHGALYGILHPVMFKQALAVMTDMLCGEMVLGDPEATKKILQEWASPFNVISLIVNRSTPLHRDGKGPDVGMDMLVTGGMYTDGIFETPSLGLTWMYNPGTVVAILGKVVPHGVKAVNGERFCMATYWRQGLFENHPIPIDTCNIVRFLQAKRTSECWQKDSGYQPATLMLAAPTDEGEWSDTSEGSVEGDISEEATE
jgi:Oxygenase domain of the 2OGFeDO superfamily